MHLGLEVERALALEWLASAQCSAQVQELALEQIPFPIVLAARRLF